MHPGSGYENSESQINLIVQFLFAYREPHFKFCQKFCSEPWVFISELSNSSLSFFPRNVGKKLAD